MTVNEGNALVKRRYDALDGLRAFSATGIVMMHVLANGNYALQGFVFQQLIPSFTDLVFLFMIISGFSVCCGYYDKFQNGSISFGAFYKKRFWKVWPFFALLCVIDVGMSPSLRSVAEAFLNMTLLFGLIPNVEISVIGVGWFLGVVFVFYLLFPFVCWLLSNKKRAWFAFAIALLLNVVSNRFFGMERRSFIYSAVYFLAGGFIFLYKESVGAFVRRGRWLIALLAVIPAVCYYMIGRYTPILLVLFALLLIYALDGEGKYIVLSNPVTRFLSSISMEIYLCHMVAFRLMEKLGLTRVFQSDLWSFLFAFVGTFVGAIIFSVLVSKALGFAGKRIRRKDIA